MHKQMFSLFFLLSLCFATSVDLSSDIDSSGLSKMYLQLNSQVLAGKSVSLSFSNPIKSVIVRDKSGLELTPTLTTESGTTKISATVPQDYLEYEITSDSFTSKNASLWFYDLRFGFSEKVDVFNAKLRLPNGAILTSGNGAAEVSSNQISLSWEAKNVDPKNKLNMRASYELTRQSDSTFFYLGLGTFVLVTLLAVIGIVIYHRSKKPEKSPPIPVFETEVTKPEISQVSKEVSPIPILPEPLMHTAFSIDVAILDQNAVFKTLDAADKDLVREIYCKGGRTTQAQLNLNTHIPKATLSRRLASLESRGIIQKSQKGIRNLITLTDLIMKT